MKSTTIPSIRVKPSFRAEVESVLRDGESLSAFLEQSLVNSVRHRQQQQAFIEKGLMSKQRSEHGEGYVSADASLAELDDILNQQ